MTKELENQFGGGGGNRITDLHIYFGKFKLWKEETTYKNMYATDTDTGVALHNDWDK